MNKLVSFIKAHVFEAILCLLCVATVIFICRPTGLYFLCDDFALVPQSMVGNLFQTHLLRPLFYCSLWLDAKVWNTTAEGFHLTNLLLHLLNSLLVFFVTDKLLVKYTSYHRHRFVALFSSLLFLTYAYHAEPIFWISGRVGLITALFLQLSLLFYLKSIKGYLPALLFFVFALFTYELSWSIPLLITLLFLYSFFYCKQRCSFKPVLVYWGVFAIYLVVRYASDKSALGTYEAGNVINGNYLTLFYNLAALVVRTLVAPAADSRIFFGLSVSAFTVIIGLLVQLRKKEKSYFVFALCLFACVIVSVLPAVSLGINTHTTESERYIYPATVFACPFVVFLLVNIVKSQTAYRLLLLAILGFHCGLLYRASKNYRYASALSRLTVQSVNRVDGVKHIEFFQLPATYNGALLFRVGFVKSFPGVLTNQYQTVHIHSYRELTEPIAFAVKQDSVCQDCSQLRVDFSNHVIWLRQ